MKILFTTIFLAIIYSGNCKTPDPAKYSLFYVSSFQLIDERTLVNRNFSGKVFGAFQNCIGITKIWNFKYITIESGLAGSYEHSNTFTSFNTKIQSEDLGVSLEFVDRFSKILLGISTSIAYQLKDKYRIGINLHPQFGIYRSVRNTRYYTNTASAKLYGIFFNDFEFNPYIERKFNKFSLRIMARLFHMKKDNALFFEEKWDYDTHTPNKERVDLKWVDIYNPLKISFGMSYSL